MGSEPDLVLDKQPPRHLTLLNTSFIYTSSNFSNTSLFRIFPSNYLLLSFLSHTAMKPRNLRLPDVHPESEFHWNMANVYIPQYWYNILLRFPYSIHFFWPARVSEEPKWSTTLHQCSFWGSIIVYEIFCWMINRWINRAEWQPCRQKLLKGIVPILENDLEYIEEYRCTVKGPLGRYQQKHCLRIRVQELKRKIQPMYDKIIKELEEYDKQNESAAIRSGMSHDIESQGMRYRKPTNTLSYRQQYLISDGHYDCNCTAPVNPKFRKAAYTSLVRWTNELQFNSFPTDGRHLNYPKSSRESIDAEIKRIQAYHKAKARSYTLKALYKGRHLEDGPYMI